MTNLTIVIPAKYESESLPIVLDQFIGKSYDVCVVLEKYESESLPIVLSQFINKNYEILVVLEKSDLKTIDAIKDKNCKIIYQTKKGFGNALIEGINNSKTDFFCIFNADGSMEINEIDLMLKKIKNSNCDIIFASRYEKNSKSDEIS